MATSQKRLTVDLAKTQVARLTREAKRKGVTPQRYVKQLIESNLEDVQIARTRTFAQIMGPHRGEVDEAELDRLIETARTEFHNLSKKTK